MIKLKGHQILKALFKHYMIGERKSRGGTIVNPLGRSYTTIELNEITNYPVILINDICISLKENGYIELHNSNEDFKVYRYIITTKGMDAYITKHYVFSVWEFVLKWIPIGISVLSLSVAFAVFYYNVYNSKSIERLQQQISESQQKIKVLENHLNKTN